MSLIKLNWDNGRQGTGYSKLTLISSPTYRIDTYVIKIPAGVSIPPHKDSAPDGYNHNRLNITFRGPTKPCMQVDGPIKRWWRFEYFLPSEYTHSKDAVNKDTWILSIGWLTKN